MTKPFFPPSPLERTRKPRPDADGRIHKEVVTEDAGMLEDLWFVLSDETKDRYGEVIVASGWKLTNFRKNPIALFAHRSELPLGTWKSPHVEGNRLVAQLDMADAGTSPRIDEIRSLLKQKVLRAVSVGFQPVKMEPMNPKADPEDWWEPQRYLESDLLECSVVSVPANPNAVQLEQQLQLCRQLGISDATVSLIFGESAIRDGIRQRSASPGVIAPGNRTT